MKKNQLFFTTLLLSGLVAGGSVAYAADSTYATNGHVAFEADDSPTPPVDPTDPTTPVDPDPTPNPGTSGPLSLDFASSFDFGTQKITTTDKTYYAKLQSFTNSDDDVNYVQDTDKRGTMQGWKLSVMQDDSFKTAEDEVLEGAQITLTKGEVASETDAAYAPTAKANVTLVPGQDSGTVVNAEAGKGMGTWIYRFGNDAASGADAVKLVVPGKTVKLAKAYTTTITWTLSDTPDNTTPPNP
ncbi:WxL domain-containing protein [Enterococcus sp. ZJ1668]|uniref:WxL domain-containing protein n=1 Tax=Enterococcus sp. ZJ1668 TaxID=2709402 RepID=UPI0013EE07DB|nr:WxL domain-containing protein [Enterococcus sp. ZJ1668]